MITRTLIFNFASVSQDQLAWQADQDYLLVFASCYEGDGLVTMDPAGSGAGYGSGGINEVQAGHLVLLNVSAGGVQLSAPVRKGDFIYCSNDGSPAAFVLVLAEIPAEQPPFP